MATDKQKPVVGSARSKKKEGVLKVFVFVIFYTKWFSCYIKLFEGMAVSVSKEGEPSEKSFVIARWGVLLPKELFFSLVVIQELQASQTDVLKLCPCKHSQEPKTIRAQEVTRSGPGTHMTVHSNRILGTHWEFEFLIQMPLDQPKRCRILFNHAI